MKRRKIAFGSFGNEKFRQLVEGVTPLILFLALAFPLAPKISDTNQITFVPSKKTRAKSTICQASRYPTPHSLQELRLLAYAAA